MLAEKDAEIARLKEELGKYEMGRNPLEEVRDPVPIRVAITHGPIPLEHAGLHHSVEKRLCQAGFRYLNEVLLFTKRELLRIEGFGEKCFEILDAGLGRHGLNLPTSAHEVPPWRKLFFELRTKTGIKNPRKYLCKTRLAEALGANTPMVEYLLQYTEEDLKKILTQASLVGSNMMLDSLIKNLAEYGKYLEGDPRKENG